jgi:hypothetical protein
MSIHAKRAAWFSSAIALVLVLVSLSRIGAAHWYPYVLFAVLVGGTAASVESWTKGRSRAVVAAAVVIAIGCLAAVWLALRSEEGRDILQAVIVAILVVSTGLLVAALMKRV